ncbi:hypothetical protein [Nocardiopsis synnemataformans]|uniref:hypothetical protein n=1 Tax=Nocardiopsis synnemataformans TaxID=61305 RepID=UPI003EB9C413
MESEPRARTTNTTPGDHLTDAAVTADRDARLAAVRADLAQVAASWPDLHQLRLPGARRRTARRTLSPAARAVLDRLTRAEKADRKPGERVLGASPAPVTVSILDDLAEILAAVVALSDRISWNAGVADPEVPSSAYDFAAIDRHVAHVAEHLGVAASTDPDALKAAEAFAAWARRVLERSLEQVVDGQVLSALCAWCHGATTRHPAGGQHTLTVRVVAGEPLIVCVSDTCEPPAEDCRTWLRGRPAWPERDWEWLAARLDAPVFAAPARRG